MGYPSAGRTHGGMMRLSWVLTIDQCQPGVYKKRNNLWIHYRVRGRFWSSNSYHCIEFLTRVDLFTIYLYIYNIKIRGATTKISKGTLLSFFGHFGHICMLLEFDNLKTWRSCGIQDHQTLEAYICAQNDQRSSPKCPWRF